MENVETKANKPIAFSPSLWDNVITEMKHEVFVRKEVNMPGDSAEKARDRTQSLPSQKMPDEVQEAIAEAGRAHLLSPGALQPSRRGRNEQVR